LTLENSRYKDSFLAVLSVNFYFIQSLQIRVVSSIIWGLYNRPEVAAVPSGLSPTPLIIIIIKIIPCHQVTRLVMLKVIPPSPLTSSWHATLLSTGSIFPFILHFFDRGKRRRSEIQWLSRRCKLLF
jgi:hypothetical protein